MSKDWISESALEKWEAHGLECAIVQSPLSAFNGYVRLPKEHPAFGKDYYDIDVEAPGGLTYANSEDGWVGFDTLHLGDVWPALLDDERYASIAGRDMAEEWHNEWDLPKLRAEVEHLAEQLAAVSA